MADKFKKPVTRVKVTDWPTTTESDDFALRKAGQTETSGRLNANKLRSQFQTNRSASDLPKVKVESTDFKSKGGTSSESGRDLAKAWRSVSQEEVAKQNTDLPKVKSNPNGADFQIKEGRGQTIRNNPVSAEPPRKPVPTDPIKPVRGLAAKQAARQAAKTVTDDLPLVKAASEAPKSSSALKVAKDIWEAPANLGKKIIAQHEGQLAEIAESAAAKRAGMGLIRKLPNAVATGARLAVGKAAGTVAKKLMTRTIPAVGTALALADTANWAGHNVVDAVKEGYKSYEASKEYRKNYSNVLNKIVNKGYKPKASPKGMSN